MLFIPNNSINQSFVYTQLNGQTVLFLTIQYNTNHLFAHNLNVHQFYLTRRKICVRCYHSKSEWTWEQWQWRSTLHSPKLQHYWSHTIRLFSVIYPRYSLRRSYPSAEMQSMYYSVAPDDWDMTVWGQMIIDE